MQGGESTLLWDQQREKGKQEEEQEIVLPEEFTRRLGRWDEKIGKILTYENPIGEPYRTFHEVSEQDEVRDKNDQ